MFKTGLVSITFRQLMPKEIIELVVQAGLAGIEWGGDIHVPHGDVAQATSVQQWTADAGLVVAAYGSYYRVGHPESGPFEAVLASAVALSTPLIRVWAGKQGTDTTDAAYFDQVVADSCEIAALAAQAGVDIAYEFHANTLTDTHDGTRRLLNAVNQNGCHNIYSYWQPPRFSVVEENLAAIETIKPWQSHVHLFSWHPESGERLALAELESDWLCYLEALVEPEQTRFALLEFVVDNEPENFLRDAGTLKRWLQKV